MSRKNKTCAVDKYHRQRNANVLDFFGKDFEKRRLVFFKIVAEFEKKGVYWALGCSSNLFFRGIVDDFNDFDFIVDQTSLETIESIMDSLGGVLLGTGGNGFCESDMYMHFALDGCDIDIISGFRLQTFGTSFYYPYSANEVEIIDLDYMHIPLITVEALFILYAMMEGWQPRRRFKRKLIFEYLQTVGVNHPEILRRCDSSYALPTWITDLIVSVL